MLFFFNDTATTEIYTLSLTTLFRSENGTGYYDLAMCDLDLGRREEARRLLEHVAKIDPEHQGARRSEEHTSELQSLTNLVCRLLLEKKKKTTIEQKTKIRKITSTQR